MTEKAQSNIKTVQLDGSSQSNEWHIVYECIHCGKGYKRNDKLPEVCTKCGAAENTYCGDKVPVKRYVRRFIGYELTLKTLFQPTHAKYEYKPDNPVQVTKNNRIYVV